MLQSKNICVGFTYKNNVNTFYSTELSKCTVTYFYMYFTDECEVNVLHLLNCYMYKIVYVNQMQIRTNQDVNKEPQQS